MKLQLVETIAITRKGGNGWRKIFETPNGTRVVKLKNGYYSVSKSGTVNTKRKFCGKVENCEVWEVRGEGRRVSQMLVAIA